MSENKNDIAANAEERNFAFTLDVIACVRLWMADEVLRERVFKAIEMGPAENTTAKLGYSNLGTEQEPEWKTVFGATRRDPKEIAEEGLFYLVGKHKNPLHRLRHQKAQVAQAGASMEESVVSAKDVDIEKLAVALKMTKEEVIKMAGVNAAKPAPKANDIQDDGYAVPPHVAAIIAKTRIE